MRNARHPPALIDEVLERYLDWRQASRDVTAAYDTWRTVDRAERARAYADYCEALDAEERAAEDYRVLIDQISASAASDQSPPLRAPDHRDTR